MPTDAFARALANRANQSAVAFSPTVAAASAKFIPADCHHIRTAGHGAPGDMGGGLYKRAGSAPAHAGKFQSADGAWWELAEPAVSPEMFGAKGDCVYNFATNTATGTDDSAAVQAAFDYFQLRGAPGIVRFRTLYRINSVQPMGAAMNCGINHYGDGIAVERTSSGLAGMVFTASAATANYRGYHVNGGGKTGSNDASANRVVDAPGLAIIATVAQDSKSITLTPGAGANFVAGDIVFLRTGQCLNTGITEPDSELNEVESVSGDTVTLKYPALVTYAQEYYVAGTSGLTTTTVTANAAPFTLAKVTARVMQGVRIDIDLIGHNCTQVLNLWGVLHWHVSDTTRIWHGFNGAGQRETRFGYWGARNFHTARINNAYWFAPSTGCTSFRANLWGESPSGYAFFHFHEGLKNFIATSVYAVMQGTGALNSGISILSRAYALRFNNVYIDTGTAIQPAISVGSAADTIGNYCDGGVSFGAITFSNTNSAGSAILVNGANVSFDSNPVALGAADRLSNVTYLRNPTHGIRIGDLLFGPFLHDRQLILGTIGQDAEIELVRSRVDVAYASGDRRRRIGFSGTMNAYISDQAINALAVGDVTETRRGVTTLNGGATTSAAGTSLGAPQSATRQIVAEINAGSGTTNYTAGRERISVLVRRSSRTS